MRLSAMSDAFLIQLNDSFESLLLLTNETKVAFIVIGTEDAYSKSLSEMSIGEQKIYIFYENYA